MVKFLVKNKFWLIPVILFLLLRLPSLFEPYWYGDEGIYLTIGQAIKSGLILFRQIHDNKPPTLYYLATIGQTVFGFRLLLTVFMAFANLAFLLLAKKLLPRRFAIISFYVFLIFSSIPLIEGNIANAEVFMLLPTILAFYLFFSSPITNYRLLITGLLLGFAFTIKVPVAVEFIFLCFWLLVFNFKKLKFLVTSYLLLVIGFLLPISLWAVYFYLHHAFNDFIFAAILQNFGYLSSWATGTHSGSATGSGLMVKAIILLVSYVVLFIPYHQKKLDKKNFFILAWFVTTLFGALLSSRPYPHYLLQVLPPLSLIIGLVSSRKYLYLVPLFILAIIITSFKFYYYEPFSYYLNFYSHIIGVRSTVAYQNYFSAEVPFTYQMATYVKSHTQPSDSIFIWGDQPFVYALSQRLPSSKFVVAYHVVDFNQYDFVVNQLKISYPKLIVYYPMSNRPYPQLDNFVKRFYSPVTQIGNAIVYSNNSQL